MTSHDQLTSFDHGSHRPSKRTGWLKMALATSGVTLTVLGMGMIARREVDQPPTTATAESTTIIDLQPIPTVVPVDSAASLEGASLGAQQLQAPSFSRTQQFMTQPLTRSRSSR